MKNIFKGFVYASMFILAMLPFRTAAAGDITIDLENTPLFAGAQFAPGGTVTRFIKVSNNSATSQTMAIEAINQLDPSGLASQFSLSISESGTVVYNGSLADFFAPGEKTLSVLAGNGTQTEYLVALTLNSAAEDLLQNKSLSFDLVVGFKGNIPTPPADSNGGGSGGGSGSGGSGSSIGSGVGNVPPGLTIFEDQIIITDVTQTSATIQWNTSYGSTSQVVYAAAGEPYNFVIDPAAQYGYPHATTDDLTKVTNHSVTITGLVPNTSYHFRVISHASPPTVSFEHQFTTLANGEVAGAEIKPARFTNLPESNHVAIAGSSLNSSALTKEGLVLGDATVAPVSVSVAANSVSLVPGCQQKPFGAKEFAIYAIVLLLITSFLHKQKNWISLSFQILLLVLSLAWWMFYSCNNLTWLTPTLLVLIALGIIAGGKIVSKPIMQ
jgi:hypothetical protein